jgi:hypothetical protein
VSCAIHVQGPNEPPPVRGDVHLQYGNVLQDDFVPEAKERCFQSTNNVWGRISANQIMSRYGLSNFFVSEMGTWT